MRRYIKRNCVCTAAVIILVFVLDPAHLSGQIEIDFSIRKGSVDLYGDVLPRLVCGRLGTTRFRAKRCDFALARDGKTVAFVAGNTVQISEAETGQVLHKLVGDRNSRILGYSPDSNLLALAGEKKIEVWDVASGMRLWHFKWKTDDDIEGQFSNDSKQFAATIGVRCAVLWNAYTGKILNRIASPTTNTKLIAQCVSPDGAILASYLDTRRIILVQLVSGKIIRTIARHVGPIDWMTFTPNSKTIATVSEDCKSVNLWDISTGARTQIQAPEAIYSLGLRFSKCGNTVLFKDVDVGKTLWVFDRKTRQLRRIWYSEATVYSFDISPNGRQAAVLHEHDVCLFDIQSGKFQKRFPGGQQSQYSIRFSSDGKWLAAFAGQALQIWDVATGRLLTTPTGHTDYVSSISCASNADVIASGGFDSTVRIWDLKTSRQLHCFRHGTSSVSLVVLSPHGRKIATFGSDFKIRVCDVEREKLLWQLENIPELASVPGGGYHNIAMSFDRSGNLLAVGNLNSSKVKVYSAKSGELLEQISLPTTLSLRDVSFSPVDSWIAISTKPNASDQSRLFLWKYHRNQFILADKLSAKGHLTFSHDGKILACSDERKVSFWEFKTKRHIYTWTAPRGNRADICFTRSGRIFSAVVYDTKYEGDTIIIHELLSKNKKPHAIVSEYPYYSYRLSGNGERLFTSADTTILVRKIDSLIQPTKIVEIDVCKMKTLWDTLSNVNVAKAFRAVTELRQGGDAVVSFLGKQLHAVPSKDHSSLIRDLNSKRSQVRQSAVDNLANLGWDAEFALRKARKSPSTLEVHRRIVDLLERLEKQPLPKELLQKYRAIMILELIGSRQAQKVLNRLRTEAPGNIISSEAAASLERLRFGG